MLKRSYYCLHTEHSEPIVQSDNNDLSERRHDTSVVRISGPVVVWVAVDEHHNRK